MNLYAVASYYLGYTEKEELELKMQEASNSAEAILLAVEGKCIPKELDYLRNDLDGVIEYYADGDILVKCIPIKN